MERRGNKILLNDAVSQFDRWLPALAPDYAEVDGRGFGELLDFAARFGALINFYDTEDRIDGTWTEFFLADPTIFLSSLIHFDSAAVLAGFQALDDRFRRARGFHQRFEIYCEMVAYVRRVGEQVDRWLRIVLQSGAGVIADVGAELPGAAQTHLGAALGQLADLVAEAADPEALDREIGLSFETFSAHWRLSRRFGEGALYEGQSRTARFRSGVRCLWEILNALVATIEGLQRKARQALPETLNQADHAPNNALYLAFSRIFRHARATLNTFSRRYIQFYYRDMLQQREAGPIADHAWLAFVAADGARTKIPKGSLFSAGADPNGNDIVFAATSAIGVDPAQIAQIYTLRVLEGSPIQWQSGDTAGTDWQAGGAWKTATMLLASKVSPVAAEAEPEPDDGAESSAPFAVPTWPTFGPAAPGDGPLEETRAAEIGLAVSTDILLLSGGDRKITLDLRLGFPDGSAFSKTRLVRAFRERIGDAADAVVETILDRCFRVSLTTADGWIDVEDVAISILGYRLRFELTVSADMPAIAALPPPEDEADAVSGDFASVADINPDPETPTIKLALRPGPLRLTAGPLEFSLYPLAFFGNLRLDGVALALDVQNLPVTQVANTDGDLDPANPFAFFGALPVPGSYCDIYQPELFAKPIDSLAVTMDWFDLPQGDTGFKDYYRDYVIGPDGKPQTDLFDNQSFKVTLSLVNPTHWRLAGPDKAPVEYFLYRTEPPGDVMDPPPETDEKLWPLTTLADAVIDRRDPPRRSDAATSAVRITLVAPSYGFGNALYAQNVLNAVIKDLPDADFCEAGCERECGVFKLVAQALDQALAGAGSLHGQAYIDAVWPEVFAQFLVLAGKARDCFRACYHGEAETSPESEPGGLFDPAFFYTHVRSILSEDPASVARDKRKTLSELHRRMQQVMADVREASTTACEQKCLPTLILALELLDAIIACILENSETPPEIVIPEALLPVVAALQAQYETCMQICAATCMKPGTELAYPNDPYLPTAFGITLAYGSSNRLYGGDADRTGAKLFHLMPFGGYRELPAWSGAPVDLLPRFEEAGYHYLGLGGVSGQQMLSLLYRMGSLPTEVRLEQVPPAPVGWRCLTDNVWKNLPENAIVSDTTKGLQSTGIVKLLAPFAASVASKSDDEAPRNPDQTVLPPGLDWLQAVCGENPGDFPPTVAIHPHAGLVERQVSETTDQVDPLPAGSINAAVEELAGVETILQPMPTFGGRSRENARRMKMRVGERLRHKDRAILPWDYERLVLERFPDIWKAVALPAAGRGGAPKPGSVLVVVVSGTRRARHRESTVPACSAERLESVRQYLSARASPFTEIRVENPVYVRIAVTASVWFSGSDEVGADVKRLQRDLTAWLSPWFYDVAREATQGDYVDEAAISAFIQTRPYVDGLAEIALACAPQPRSLDADCYFLTSALHHTIEDARFTGGEG